jgi:hypothetical protein
MPAISVFFGITIRMYYADHSPPHFHAEYQGQVGKFTIQGEMIVGRITSRPARRLIREWASLHRDELEANWHRTQRHLPIVNIAPLP